MSIIKILEGNIWKTLEISKLKPSFKRKMKWNKYQLKVSIERQN